MSNRQIGHDILASITTLDVRSVIGVGVGYGDIDVWNSTSRRIHNRSADRSASADLCHCCDS
jgi:hypothetical protein